MHHNWFSNPPDLVVSSSYLLYVVGYADVETELQSLCTWTIQTWGISLLLYHSQCAIRRRKSFQYIAHRASSQIFAFAQVNMSVWVRDPRAVQTRPQQEPSYHNSSKPLNWFETVEMARGNTWNCAGNALSHFNLCHFQRWTPFHPGNIIIFDGGHAGSLQSSQNILHFLGNYRFASPNIDTTRWCFSSSVCWTSDTTTSNCSITRQVSPPLK